MARAAAVEHAPRALARAEDVMAKAARENFPVALRLLARDDRRHLAAVYGFARLVDDAGDLAEGDRLELLDWIEDDLDRAYRGEARHVILQRVGESARARTLPRAPFVRLIDANRQDQRVARYATYAELEGYCDLSANPVGELVLHAFGAATPQRIRWSNAICTALQLAEHWQDVGEDYRAGRIYVPREDLDRYRVPEADLGLPEPTDRFRRLMGFQVERARAVLREGLPLVASLRGRHRIAVAAFAGGGLAALDAVSASGYDVLRRPPRAGTRARLAATLHLLREAGR